MERVDVVVDEAIPVDLAYFPSVVTVTLDDGRALTERVDVPEGYPEKPLARGRGRWTRRGSAAPRRSSPPGSTSSWTAVLDLEHARRRRRAGACSRRARRRRHAVSDDAGTAMGDDGELAHRRPRGPRPPRTARRVARATRRSSGSARRWRPTARSTVARRRAACRARPRSASSAASSSRSCCRTRSSTSSCTSASPTARPPVVLVNTEFRGYMLEYVLNDAACTTLIADAEYLERLCGVRGGPARTSRPWS